MQQPKGISIRYSLSCPIAYSITSILFFFIRIAKNIATTKATNSAIGKANHIAKEAFSTNVNTFATHFVCLNFRHCFFLSSIYYRGSFNVYYAYLINSSQINT